MAFHPGQQVGRFRIVRLLAQGGMAEVYKVDQELAGGIFRPAALKVIRPEYTESDDFREMFLDEARTACTLSHPNIVHLYEVGEVDGLLYMAMELVSGETLSNVSRSLKDMGRRFSDEALLAIGLHTLSALEAVHALELPGEGHLNLVHRDVSPHNLLLSSRGSLKLIDFGIAKAATNRNLTNPGVTKGKAGYFSPEQAMGRPLDGRSDLFSLGITLYKLASGATPFDGHASHLARNQALISGEWDPLEVVCPGLLPGLYTVIGKALQLDPDQRYGSAHEMRAAMERVALEAGIHIGPSSLTGYLDDAGEVSDVAHIRSVARQAPSAPSAPSAAPVSGPKPIPPSAPDRTPESEPKSISRPSSPRRPRTERLIPKTDDTPLSALRIVAVTSLTLAALTVLGGGGWLLVRAAGAPELQAQVHPLVEPAPVEPVRVEPAAEPVQAPDASLAAAAPVMDAGSEPGSEVALTPVVPSTVLRSRERRRPLRGEGKRSRTVARSPVNAGEGRLRIGAEPEGTVLVGAENWGAAPVDRRVAAGQYRVSVVAPDGKRGTCSATVVPDRTTIIIYSFTEQACQRSE